jgi:hypothetical protein
MKTRFYTDNGAPCWGCKGTIYGYTVDDAVTYVSAHCLACGRDNMFNPPKSTPLDTAAKISAAHRKESIT